MKLTDEEVQSIRADAVRQLREAGVTVSPGETQRMDVVDFRLGKFRAVGLVEFVYVNTDRYAAKELVMLPGQTCPEHWHPPVGEHRGKQETFRCRAGEVYLYVEGASTATPTCRPPEGDADYYSVWCEMRLVPGQQHTLDPGIRHWFQAGPHGAVVSEFSSASRDETDAFTDPRIRWDPQ